MVERDHLRLLLCLVALLSAGCGSPAPARKPPPPGSAVLEGVVRLQPGVELPAYTQPDLGWDRLLPGDMGDTDCPRQSRLEVLSLTAERALGGVVVAASGFTGEHLYERKLHPVTFERCALTPRLIAASEGDMLELRNRGAGAVPLTFGPVARPIAIAEGGEHRIPLGVGVESLMCPRGVGCGRTDVVVFHHSVHAVTDAQGRFRIAGFPSRQNVLVHVWHPLLKESLAQVWLDAGEHRQVELQAK